MEKQVKRNEIYNGKIIKVVNDEVVLDDGKITHREVVYHKGGACIALKDPDDDKYFMVKQYRYALNQDMLEFCAGKLEDGEDHFTTAKREVEEELGYEVDNLIYHGYMIPTCGYSSEKIYLFSGVKGKHVGQHLDENERITTYKYSLKEIEDMIQDGTINDAKTIVLTYYLKS